DGGAGHVARAVLQRFFERVGDPGAGGQVDHTVGAAADLLDGREVPNVGLEDLDLVAPGVPVGGRIEPHHRAEEAELVVGAGRQVIDDPKPHAAPVRGGDQVPADEAAASGDDELHGLDARPPGAPSSSA